MSGYTKSLIRLASNAHRSGLWRPRSINPSIRFGLRCLFSSSLNLVTATVAPPLQIRHMLLWRRKFKYTLLPEAPLKKGNSVKRIALLVVLLTSLNLPRTSAQKPDRTALVLTNVTVIDATGAAPKPGMAVVIESNRIARIVETRKAKIPAGARVVDATGKFLIPGLWDMHVHIVFGDWIPGGKEVSLPLFVANGVTGVRDMGGDLEVEEGWRKEIAAGTLIGPRMILAG